MKIIYTSGDTSEAHIISGLLNAHGIEAHIGGKYLQGGIGDLAAMDFVNVQVLESDIERARDIIAEYDGVQNEPQKTYHVKKHSIKVKLFWTVLLSLLMFLILYSVIENH